MATFKTCILHVGTEKTGSTALQKFFGLNWAELLRRGVYVPRSVAPHAKYGVLNHIDLATAACEDLRPRDDLQLAAGIRSADDLARHRYTVEQRLFDELNTQSQGASSLLISNEHIHSRLRSQSELYRLRTLLRSHCENIRVIVYLRAQCELAESVASTAVRNGQPILRLVPDFSAQGGFDPILGVDQGYFDYLALLNRLSSVFGVESLDVRLYEKAALIDEDIVRDFFGRLNIETNSMVHPGRPNKGLGKSAMVFLMSVNRHFLRLKASEAARQKVLEYLDEVESGGSIKPDKCSVNSFMQQFSDSNEQVRERWFPERSQLFTIRLDSYPETATQPELLEEELYEYIVGLVSRNGFGSS